MRRSERLQKYERGYIENYDPDSENPETPMIKAKEQYEKDKALREKIIRNRDKNNSERLNKLGIFFDDTVSRIDRNLLRDSSSRIFSDISNFYTRFKIFAFSLNTITIFG